MVCFRGYNLGAAVMIDVSSLLEIVDHDLQMEFVTFDRRLFDIIRQYK